MFANQALSFSPSFRRTSAIAGVAMLAIILCASAVSASGSSRGGVTAGPTGPASDPFLATHIVKATVVAVDAETGRFTIRDLRTETLHELSFHPELSMRAKKKKDFGGRRNLTAADIAAGQIIKLTVRDADGAVLRLRVEGSVET